MSSLLSSHHALQVSDTREDHNDAKQLPLDQTDNIDGKLKSFYFLLYHFFFISYNSSRYIKNETIFTYIYILNSVYKLYIFYKFIYANTYIYI